MVRKSDLSGRLHVLLNFLFIIYIVGNDIKFVTAYISKWVTVVFFIINTPFIIMEAIRLWKNN